MAPHYLRKSKHVGFPRRQIYLEVTWDRTINPERCDRATDALVSWRASSWDGGPGEERPNSASDGNNSASFWYWLSAQLRHGMTPWLWIEGACHALTLLGFWGLCESGEWYLSLGDCDALPANRQGLGNPGAGMCVVEDSPTIILAISSDRRRSIKIVDTRNLGCDSLRDATDCAVGPRAGAEWLQQWCRTVDDLQLGGLRHTAAAQAWHGWRHSYLDDGVLIHENGDARTIERAAVHPGRAETYRLGEVSGGAFAYDASAHYPACATASTLPCRLKWCGRCTLGDVAKAISKGWLAIARCRVRCARATLPCRWRGLTIWPIGEWTVTLAGPELTAAIDSGTVVSIDEAALYEGGLPCSRFVRTLWAARERAAAEGRGAARQCVKSLLNSLVGKWASKLRAWVDEPESCPPAPWSTWYRYHGPGKELTRYRSIAWHAQRQEEGPDAPDSCPALAAWTYSEGRVRLQRWMNCVGTEDCYYVDSDSIFTSAAGSVRLADAGHVTPGHMGALRLQGVYQTFRIGGIKSYTADDRTVCAGVPVDGGRIETDGWHYWAPRTVRESVDEHARPEPVVREIVVPLIRAYRHGTVDASGRVHPINVGVMADEGV